MTIDLDTGSDMASFKLSNLTCPNDLQTNLKGYGFMKIFSLT